MANVQLGPDMRRGIAEWNGEGETVGGIVVVRYGANARQVIQDVKKRLDEAMKGLPPDVTYSIAYDRSALIDRAVKTLEGKLFEESLVVALVCLLFLLHLRSALVAILILPIAVLISFLVMFGAGHQLEHHVAGRHCHRHRRHGGCRHHHDRERAQAPGARPGKKPHWQIIRDASVEVGPTLFYSLLVITVSFIPVFTLQAQEGRLFKPLAFTKTYSMAAAALLSITLAPILMGFFIRGKIPPEEKNPLNRFLIWAVSPGRLISSSAGAGRWLSSPARLWPGFSFPWNRAGRATCCRTASSSNGPSRLGQALPLPEPRLGIHAAAVRRRSALHAHHLPRHLARPRRAQILQQTDKIIRTFPEVQQRLRQDRPRGDRHRSRPDRHDRDHYHAQGRKGLAGSGYPGCRRQDRSRIAAAPPTN